MPENQRKNDDEQVSQEANLHFHQNMLNKYYSYVCLW